MTLPRRTFTLQEVAEMTGVTKSTAYHWVSSGLLRAVRVMGKGRSTWLVRTEDFDEFLDRNSTRGRSAS